MKRILFYLISLLPIISIGQGAKLPEAMLCSPVLVIIDTEQGTETGSGVFISDSSNIYFVTARHVLFSTDTIKKNNKKYVKFHFLSTKLGNLIFYPHNIINGSSSMISIDFKSAFNDSLIFDMNQDIAVVLLGQKHKINTSLASIEYIKQVQRDKSTNIYSVPIEITRKYLNTNVGGEIYLFGYPTSIGLQQSPQFDYYRPLLRKGIIAGKYEKAKTIIIDSPVYFGNSGGPVFELVSGLMNEGFSFGNEPYFLIGIVTEYVPYVEQWENKRIGAVNIQVMNSGYSIVTSIDYALDLIKKFK